MTDTANGAGMAGEMSPEAEDILIVDDNKANLRVLSGMLGGRPSNATGKVGRRRSSSATAHRFCDLFGGERMGPLNE